MMPTMVRDWSARKVALWTVLKLVISSPTKNTEARESALHGGDKFVAQGRENVLHRLGQDDAGHHMGLGEADAPGGLPLAPSTAPMPARMISEMKAEAFYHQSRHDALGVRQFKGHQLGQADPEEVQLEKDGGAPEDLHIYVEDGPEDFQAAHPHEGHHHAQQGPQEHGDCRDPKGAPTGPRGTPDNISTKP